MKARATKERVWNWIRQRDGPIRAREVATAFGISMSAATNAMGRLRDCGAIRHEGRTHKARWHIANPDADVADRRGLHPNQLANLRPNWKRTTGNSHPKTKQRTDWPARTLLEHYFGLDTVARKDKVHT